MRSILKLTGLITLIFFVPFAISGYFVVKSDNEVYLIISQILIILIIMGTVIGAMRLIKNYENETLNLIKKASSIEDLKALREKRYGYKSKALITKEILIKEFSEEEAIKLRKYTSSVSDMDHYYAGFISTTEGDKREEYKIRRDNFKKKYKNKRLIYPDFRENLKTTIKWMIAFFIVLFIPGLIKINATNKDLAILAALVQMAYGAGFMINTIVWISRTLKSYWDKDYL